MMLQVLDDLIGEVQGISAREGFRELEAVPSLEELPFRTGENANHGVVLKSETAVELRGDTETCAFALATSDISLVRDGRVLLNGPDILRIPHGMDVPFAEVLLVAGSDIEPGDLEKVSECLSAKNLIEGYLLRAVPGRVWGRVSDTLASRGFGLAHLAAVLIATVKERVPHVTAAEVVLVTSSTADVAVFEPLRTRWQDIAHDLRKAVWAQKGVDIDCPYGGHCGSCSKKDTCDEIRRMDAARKASESTSEGEMSTGDEVDDSITRVDVSEGSVES